MRVVALLLALLPSPCAAWSLGARPTPTAATPGVRRAAAPRSMARWTSDDLRSARLPLPAEVEALLSEETSRKDVEILWAALRACFDDERDAVAAAVRSPTTILPYLNAPSNIYGSYEYLVEQLGVEGAREVCAKNPGVLACRPAALRQTSAESIVNAANAIDFIESIPIPLALRNSLDKVIFVLGASFVAKRILIDCAGQSCGMSS
ncbi:hypothetical protein AB1Y20_000841 [Prymnesium parvum]|uniref:Uncharacterized protein n=1 Tax=Prymnesium parvum TaxID=97485 RepID=A0AB34K9I1_PRYPA